VFGVFVFAYMLAHQGAPVRLQFACTSEDINNLAYATMIQDSCRSVVLPHMDALIYTTRKFALGYAGTPMLGRTHGQAATPTTVGKEMANWCARLEKHRHALASVQVCGKFNGAVGNFNAHMVAYPEVCP
jgi:adenylosuccinate lyase